MSHHSFHHHEENTFILYQLESWPTTGAHMHPLVASGVGIWVQGLWEWTKKHWVETQRQDRHGWNRVAYAVLNQRDQNCYYFLIHLWAFHSLCCITLCPGPMWQVENSDLIPQLATECLMCQLLCWKLWGKRRQKSRTLPFKASHGSYLSSKPWSKNHPRNYARRPRHRQGGTQQNRGNSSPAPTNIYLFCFVFF